MSDVRLVAICDILGFKNLLKCNPLDKVVDDTIGWSMRALQQAIDRGSFPSKVPRKAETQISKHIGVTWFSDTVLIYSLRNDDQAIQELIMTVGWLIFGTMLYGPRIRGGISYGEARIDPEKSIFVGKAIADAHCLERRQEWSGAALTESARDRIPEDARSGRSADWWVIPYNVPLKDGSTISTLAVNWTRGKHRLDWRLHWSEHVDDPTDADCQDKPEICRKFLNTKAFHEACCRHCNPLPRIVA